MNTRVFVAAVVIIATTLTITTNGSLGAISSLSIIAQEQQQTNKIIRVVAAVADGSSWDDFIHQTVQINAGVEAPRPQDLSAVDTSKGISIVPGSGNPGNDVFYEPSPAKVAVGSTVTWTNDDALPHTVTSGNPENGSDGIFDSGLINTDKSFSHTFDKAGLLDYYCTIHPWMTGRIIVQ